MENTFYRNQVPDAFFCVRNNIRDSIESNTSQIQETGPKSKSVIGLKEIDPLFHQTLISISTMIWYSPNLCYYSCETLCDEISNETKTIQFSFLIRVEQIYGGPTQVGWHI